MANTTVGASVQVEFASVGEMRKAIKEATSDLIAMQEQFGKTSPQAIEAAKRIADLKDRINDAKEQADLFDPGNKFKAFANAASQVAAGFSAVQGAMALVGSESEDLQKTLVKVQGAMALSQGLSQIADLGKAFDELKIVAVNAFRAIKGAIGSTGIGLLVIALGTVVAYWDDIKAAVSGVSEEQKKLNKQTEDNVAAQNKKLEALDSSDNILKRQGKSEKEILKLKIDQLKIVIAAQEEQIKQAKITKDSQVAAAKRNADITKQIIRGGLEVATAGLRLLAMPIDLVLAAANKVSSALGFGELISFNINEQITRMNEGLSNWGSNKIFDPKGIEEEGKKTIEAMDKTLLESRNKLAGYQNQVDEINKKGNEKKTVDNKKTNDQINKDNEAAAKVLDEARRSTLTEQQREEEDAIRAFEERKKTLLLAGIKDFKSIEDQRELELKTIRDKYKKIKDEEDKKIEEERIKKEEERIKKEQDALSKRLDNLLKESVSEELPYNERLAKIIERENLESSIVFESEEDRTAFKKANAEARKKLAEDEKNAIIEALDEVANTLNNASNLLGKNTKAGKVMAIAAATISMLTSAQKAYEATVGIPFVGPVLAPINAALAIAAGIKNIKEISKVKVPGQGGGGNVPTPPPPPGGLQTTAPMTPQLGATATAQALNTQAINDLGNNALRAYIVNSDIQNNDQRNAYLQRNARIG